MSSRSFAAAASALGLAVAIPVAADAAALTPEEARTAIAPFYAVLTEPAKKDIGTALRAAVTPDFASYADNGAAKTFDEVVPGLTWLAQTVPNLKWEVKDVLVQGDRVTVRGEATGTPVAPFFGVPASGKSFRIMSIDILTLRGGKVARAYHLEDWAGALRQLSAR